MVGRPCIVGEHQPKTTPVVEYRLSRRRIYTTGIRLDLQRQREATLECWAVVLANDLAHAGGRSHAEARVVMRWWRARAH